MQNGHSTTSERSWTDSASWPTWARVTPRRRWRAWSGARSACRFRACAWAPPRPRDAARRRRRLDLLRSAGRDGGALVLRLPGSARQLLVGELVGADAGTAHAESALREVGNILASHALSAVADLVGTRVLPSLPSLVFDATGPALARGDRAPPAAFASRRISSTMRACSTSSWCGFPRRFPAKQRAGPSDTVRRRGSRSTTRVARERAARRAGTLAGARTPGPSPLRRYPHARVDTIARCARVYRRSCTGRARRPGRSPRWCASSAAPVSPCSSRASMRDGRRRAARTAGRRIRRSRAAALLYRRRGARPRQGHRARGVGRTSDLAVAAEAAGVARHYGNPSRRCTTSASPGSTACSRRPSNSARRGC